MRVSVAGKIGLGFASFNERDGGDDLSSLAFDLQSLVKQGSESRPHAVRAQAS
jgi:hypothetical protein